MQRYLQLTTQLERREGILVRLNVRVIRSCSYVLGMEQAETHVGTVHSHRISRLTRHCAEMKGALGPWWIVGVLTITPFNFQPPTPTNTPHHPKLSLPSGVGVYNRGIGKDCTNIDYTYL